MGRVATTPEIIDLGTMPYDQADAIQREHVQRVIEARDAAGGSGEVILLVEHEPVITVSKRAGASSHLLARADELDRLGVVVSPTDRGGDITYHGPGQIVCYPILDLTARNLRLHAYMRLLEEAVIRTIAGFGIHGTREDGITGVWVPMPGASASKIAAMGVRVRRWVSLHGLALNVTTNLSHFDLIVPCGLAGRTVTSMGHLLGESCPPIDRVKQELASELIDQLAAHAAGESPRPR